MNSPSLSNHRLLFGLATTKYPLTKLTLLACLYCSCLLFLVLSFLLAEHSCFFFILLQQKLQKITLLQTWFSELNIKNKKKALIIHVSLTGNIGYRHEKSG